MQRGPREGAGNVVRGKTAWAPPRREDRYDEGAACVAPGRTGYGRDPPGSHVGWKILGEEHAAGKRGRGSAWRRDWPTHLRLAGPAELRRDQGREGGQTAVQSVDSATEVAADFDVHLDDAADALCSSPSDRRNARATTRRGKCRGSNGRETPAEAKTFSPVDAGDRGAYPVVRRRRP